MKAFKRILKKFDVFGVPFLLRYRNEDKYSTSLGGFVFILFAICVVAFGIYFFIPFFNRKNFNIIYYSMNLPSTEPIKLKESKAAFAVELECTNGNDGTKAEDLLNLDIKYVIYTKDKEGNKNKESSKLSTYPCNYSDFYNNYNDSIDLLNIDKLNCLDKTDYIIEGIYTDEIFSYYEFSVYSKEDTSNNFDKINDYLLSNDCKLQVY